MEQLKLRVARPGDVAEIAEWWGKTRNNSLDPGIIKYPTFRAITSYNGAGNIAHLPSQQVLMLESVALNPAATTLDAGQAFRDLVKGQQLLASSFGLREIYFIATDPAVKRVAEDHGFERIEFPVVRLKL